MNRRDHLVDAVARDQQWGNYRAEIGDRHYGATAPFPQPTCRCDQPGHYRDVDADEVRCWRCGRPPESEPTQNASEGVGPLSGSVVQAGP